VAASQGEDFLGSECVSCGACVQACPTASLIEKKVVETGTPDRAVVTTCAYCGVGCTFHAEMRGEELIGSLDAEGEDRDRRGPRSNLFKLFGCYWREVT